MPRIRTIKPEFWDSPSTMAADLRTRLLFIAMWCWADDYGIGDATPVRLIAFAFPGDEIAAKDYPTLLKEVADIYGVVFFRYEGRPYFVVPSWDRHQRTERKAKPKAGLTTAAAAAMNAAANEVEGFETPDQAVIPELSDEGEGTSDAMQGSSAYIDGSSGTGTGEQGNRGKEKEPPRASAGPPTAQRGARLPEDWRPPEEVVQQMREEVPAVNLRTEHAKFLDYWKSQPGAKGRKADWPATWRNWMRRASENTRARPDPLPAPGLSRADQKVQGYLDMGTRLTTPPPPDPPPLMELA